MGSLSKLKLLNDLATLSEEHGSSFQFFIGPSHEGCNNITVKLEHDRYGEPGIEMEDVQKVANVFNVDVRDMKVYSSTEPHYLPSYYGEDEGVALLVEFDIPTPTSSRKDSKEVRSGETYKIGGGVE